MGLFNFNFSSNTATATANDTSVIELALNEEVVTISAAEAAGKTLDQLFRQFAQRLGDVERISRYVCAGQVVDANTQPKPGYVYRGAVSSESKG